MRPHEHATTVMTRLAEHSIGIVLLGSGAFGWLLGVGTRGGQVAVESAQVLAGIVVYPSATPFSIYHAKIWTLLIQSCALAMHAGVPERVLSTLLSGLTGQLSCQVLALTAFALSRSAWISLACLPVLIVSRVADYGVVYPMVLFRSEHTYGAIGLSASVLVALFIAMGWRRSGLLLLGLLPAVHPSLGVWTTMLVLAAFARRASSVGVRSLRWYVLGLLVTLASLAVHIATMPSLPVIPASDAARYLDYFVTVWDTHRQPVALVAPGLAANVVVSVLGLAYLRWWPASLAAAGRAVLTFAVLCGVVSVLLALLSHLPASSVPAWLLIAMPSRLLNINVILFGPIVVGLLALERRTVAGALLFATLLFGVVAAEYRPLGQSHARDVRDAIADPIAAVAFAAAALLLRKAMSRDQPAAIGRLRTAAMRVVQVAISLAIFRAVQLVGVQLAAYPPTAAEAMLDYSSNDAYARIAARPGMLLASPLHRLLQLRTRRPVLMDASGINGLPYALESAPMTERVLRDAYGMDFFNPPADLKGLGMVPYESTRVAWEGFSVDRWRAIRRDYGVTDVATPIAWSLQLPTVVVGPNVRLFAIPGQ